MLSENLPPFSECYVLNGLFKKKSSCSIFFFFVDFFVLQIVFLGNDVTFIVNPIYFKLEKPFSHYCLDYTIGTHLPEV